ncbi:XRE family transcriptional regulator [Alcanivorax xiamenensis]|uniref:XRE family transcriptional regulator n=2 Tax=Alcanivorax xiamenensis TaxID=1177156 RepID=A0ABQ6Y7A5_9GAMM|nr:XRE family transcriptional regulator [Alcanivorax xiamenensis]
MVHIDDLRQDFSRRLRKATAAAGWSERGLGAQLARIAEATPKAASKWLNGEAIPRQEKMEVLAAALQVRAEWLQFGKGSMYPGSTMEIREAATEYGVGNVIPAPEPSESRMAPVISSVQAGSWTEAVDLYAPGYAEKWEPVPPNTCPYAFWLVVKGDSMTAPSGLSIPDGFLILVEPSVPAHNGSLVVAKLTDENEATFKKLVLDGPNKYLKPLNPDYKTIHINGNCRIVGTVTTAKMKLA